MQHQSTYTIIRTIILITKQVLVTTSNKLGTSRTQEDTTFVRSRLVDHVAISTLCRDRNYHTPWSAATTTTSGCVTLRHSPWSDAVFNTLSPDRGQRQHVTVVLKPLFLLLEENIQLFNPI